MDRFRIEYLSTNKTFHSIVVSDTKKSALKWIKEWNKNEGIAITIISIERIKDATGSNWLQHDCYHA